MKNEFTKKVLEAVAKIPRGELMTYQQVARAAGSPKAYRAVGSILNRNYRQKEWQLPLMNPPAGSEPIPCHRVIRSDGHVGEYARGTKSKIRLLSLEGHVVNKNRIKLPNLVESKSKKNPPEIKT